MRGASLAGQQVSRASRAGARAKRANHGKETKPSPASAEGLSSEEKADMERDLLFVEGFYLAVGKEWQICNTIFL